MKVYVDGTALLAKLMFFLLFGILVLVSFVSLIFLKNWTSILILRQQQITVPESYQRTI